MIQSGLQRRNFAWFSIAAMMVYSLAVLVGAGALSSDGARGLRGDSGLGGAVSADLILTLPVLFWWLLLHGPRSKAWWSPAGAAWSVTAVAAAGWLIAGWALSSAQAPGIVAAPLGRALSAVALGAAALYMLAWMTGTDGEFDPVDRVSSRMTEVFGEGRVAQVLTAVLSPGAVVLGLAFASWRHSPATPKGAQAFGMHRRSLHGEMLLGLLVASAAEVLAMHFLVARWHGGAAWVLTGLSLYGTVWLIADYRATVLRPMLVLNGTAKIRAGLRFQVELAASNVERIESTRPDSSSLAMTILGEPEQWLVLRSPVAAKGPYGIRREVLAVGVTVDTPKELTAALSH